jgi:chromosomal replication initiation ATPase DnaA
MTTAKFRMPRKSLLKQKTYEVDNVIVEKVINNAARVFNIRPIMVTNKGRYRENVLARNMCFYILHVHYKQKSAQIAPYFKRDRTTVLHGINTFVNDVEVVPYYMEKYLEVRKKIKVPKLYSDNF